jgi:hypothetical protein
MDLIRIWTEDHKQKYELTVWTVVQSGRFIDGYLLKDYFKIINTTVTSLQLTKVRHNRAFNSTILRNTILYITTIPESTWTKLQVNLIRNEPM